MVNFITLLGTTGLSLGQVSLALPKLIIDFFENNCTKCHDSQTLIEADKADLESNGSFQAVILSLLTSDSFLYRK